MNEFYERSGCCHRPIIETQELEYPMDSRFYIVYNVKVCECCGKRVEEIVHECAYCGEVWCDGKHDDE